MTMKPISDRAEIALDFPEKTYMGSFSRASAFEARTDAEGVTIKLARKGTEQRVVELHLHWQLFGDILNELAVSMASHAPLESYERERLARAARALAESLEPAPA
jgi:hypothetical protein